MFTVEYAQPQKWSDTRTSSKKQERGIYHAEGSAPGKDGTRHEYLDDYNFICILIEDGC